MKEIPGFTPNGESDISFSVTVNSAESPVSNIIWKQAPSCYFTLSKFTGDQFSLTFVGCTIDAGDETLVVNTQKLTFTKETGKREYVFPTTTADKQKVLEILANPI